MEVFKTQVDVEIDIDSVIPEGYKYESRTSNVDIEYNFVLETRSWGIKSFAFILPQQELSFELEMLNTRTNKYEDINFKLKIDGEVETPENISEGDLFPSMLSLEITEIQQIDENTFSGTAKAVLDLVSA